MSKMPPSKEFTAKCKEAEFFETPQWAAERILDVELMPRLVLDPAAGRSVLGKALCAKGYDQSDVLELDLNQWPGQPDHVKTGIDFLGEQVEPLLTSMREKDWAVMVNPPFSKACEFVELSLALGARKVLMFQRLSFLETATRRSFFDAEPPARIWICGERANCWRGDMPEEDMTDEDGKLVKGKKGRSTPTAHAWFVWERDHIGSMQMHRLYKE